MSSSLASFTSSCCFSFSARLNLRWRSTIQQITQRIQRHLATRTNQNAGREFSPPVTSPPKINLKCLKNLARQGSSPPPSLPPLKGGLTCKGWDQFRKSPPAFSSRGRGISHKVEWNAPFVTWVSSPVLSYSNINKSKCTKF